MLVCSLFALPMLRCLPFACQPPNCHVEPLTHLCPSKPLIGYVTACSALLIALLVAGEDWSRSLLEHLLFTCWDIIILLCYLNASIYLVKGGRLGLSPSVLFHSCRPSFRHTGVIFLDFAFLTRLGDLWDPLDSSL